MSSLKSNVLSPLIFVAAVFLIFSGTPRVYAQQTAEHVYVMSVGDDAYNEHNQIIPDKIISAFHASLPERYDFFVFYGTSETRRASGFGLYFPIQNPADGIGIETFGIHPDFALFEKLKGAVLFHDLETVSDATLSTLSLHEISHYWLAYVNRIAEKPQLTFHTENDETHWNEYVDVSTQENNVRYLSSNGGAGWIEQVPGTFLKVIAGTHTEETPRRFHPIELYLMGLLTPEQTVPLSVILPSSEELTTEGWVAHGVREPVTVYDIIDTYGDRVPHSSVSQKDFSVAFIYLKGEDELVSSDLLQRINALSISVPERWYQATNGLSTLNGITMDVVASAPAVSPMLSNGTLIKGISDGNPLTEQDAVVYLFNNGMRRPFLNESLFHLWYESFDSVVEMDADTISNIQMSSPVLPPPNTWIKIQSDPKVYEVQTDGRTLRWITSEQVALRMKGVAWNHSIYDVDVILFPHFMMGDPLL